MSHQINLFNPGLRKTALVLPARQMLMGWGAVAALMLAFYGWQLFQGNRLAGADRETAGRVQTLQAELARLGAEVSARRPSSALQAQQQRKLELLAAREDVMQVLQSGAIGNTEGHAAYLRAFARQWLDGLWLTGLTVAGAGKDIVVEGRTLKPELVPDYLTRLGREPVLKGHSFNRLQMRRPPPEVQAAGKPVLQPRFVEFTVATAAEPASVVIGGKP
jgi:hypothetical protein